MLVADDPDTQTDGRSFRGLLEPHQRDALSFLIATPRALLADDTGLGKTIQPARALGRVAPLPDARQRLGRSHVGTSPDCSHRRPSVALDAHPGRADLSHRASLRDAPDAGTRVSASSCPTTVC
jgi:hypothetical protein